MGRTLRAGAGSARHARARALRRAWRAQARRQLGGDGALPGAAGTAVSLRSLAGRSRAAYGPDEPRSRSVQALRRPDERVPRVGRVHDPDGSRRAGGLRARPAVDGGVARGGGLRLAVAEVGGRLRLPRRLRRDGGGDVRVGRHPLFLGARARRPGTAHVAGRQRVDHQATPRARRAIRAHRPARASHRARRVPLACPDADHRMERGGGDLRGPQLPRQPHRRKRSGDPATSSIRRG